MKRWYSPLVGLAVVCLASACALREIPYPELRADYGLPSSQTFVASPGVNVHYTDEGRSKGRVIILVHGFAASVHAWRPWIDRLKDDYRLIAIDLPGHGLTETPPGYQASLEGNAALVDALAAKLGVEHFVLAGNSMGGAVSLSYAMVHQDKLDGLVLVDAAGWPGDGSRGGPPAFVGLLNNDVGRLLMKMADPRMFAVDGLKSAYVDETLVTEQAIDRYVDFAMGQGHRDVLLTQRSQPARAWTKADFASIDVPTLVMVGAKDALIPPSDSKAIANAIPGAYIVSYPEGGHLPMEQLPDETVRTLRAFLQGLPPRR